MSREPRMTPMPSTMQGGWCSIGWIPSIAYASNGSKINSPELCSGVQPTARSHAIYE